MSDQSDIFGPFPGWLAAATGPHDLIPGQDAHKPPRAPRPKSRSWQDGEVRVHPDGRPVTLKALPTIQQLPEALGAVRRGQPPPDMMRVLSSFALLGALLVALVLSAVLG